MIKYLIILFLLFSVISSQVVIEQKEALDQLKVSLSQTWDLTNICTGNSNLLKCDNSQTVITKIVISNPAMSGPWTIPDASFFKLVNLTEIYLSSDILPTSTFWTNLQLLTHLTKIQCAKINGILPNDMGVYFPQSLNQLIIDNILTAIPESLLINFGGTLQLGGTNSNSGLTFPTSLSQSSKLLALYVTSHSLGFNMNGSNFINLRSLNVKLADDASMAYDKYGTFPNITYLNIQVLDTVASTHALPLSFCEIPTLSTLMLTVNNKYTTSYVIDLTSNQGINLITIESMDLSTTPTPIIARHDEAKITLALKLCTVPLDKLDISFEQLMFTSCIMQNNLPSSSGYSEVTDIYINGNYGGTIPEEVCRIKGKLQLYNTLVSALPTCFLCEWGTQRNTFQNNINLMYTQASCPNLKFDNYTMDLPTSGGTLDLFGIDLGWQVFDENGLPVVTMVIIGNSQLRVSLPPGTGSSSQYKFKFHYDTNSSASLHIANLQYSSPIINNAAFLNGAWQINGGNFYPNRDLINVYVAGILMNVLYAGFNQLRVTGLTPPYNDNIIVSVNVTVDGLNGYTIASPSGELTVANAPVTELFSGGSYIPITGEMLTFDQTIMSLTLNGIIMNLAKAESSSKLVFRYPTLTVGVSYELVYKQGAYTYNTTVTVTNQLGCQVVQGYCIGTQPYCLNGYTGPDCSSLPAGLPQPPINQTFPITSTTSPVQFNNQELNIRYSIYPTSVQELTYSGTTVKDFPMIFEKLEPNPNIYQYTMNLTGSSLFSSVIRWYKDPQIVEYSGSRVENVKSTTRYQTIISTYPFANPTNYLLMKYRIDFESIEQSDVCSAIISKLLPTDPNMAYTQSKFNYIDLFTRIDVLAMETTDITNLDFESQVLSRTPTKISQEISVRIGDFGSVFLWDFDVTVLMDAKHAKQELSPLCTPPPPVNKPCQGNPVCGGPTQGICQTNGTCTCINGYTGAICDSKPTPIPPTKPNPNTPNTDTETESGVGLHISIVSIRELDYQGNQERELTIPRWLLKQVNTIEKITYLYSSTLFNGSCLINVTIDYFNQDSVVSFAGQNSTKLAGSIKYSAQITKWPFLKQINQLEVVFSSSIKDNSESTDSCSYKNIEYDESNPLETQSNVRMVYIQVNDRTFSTTFNNLAVVDGIPRQIRNVLLPNQVNDSNTQSNSLIGVLTPHHSEYIIIDPDFNLLVSYVDPSDKEGSICSDSDKKKLTKAQLAGIIVASSVIGVALLIMAVYLIKRTTTSKILIGKMKSKLNRLN
ncbi:EGF-like domain-containing protein [Tieghemostelium lacteum]|uniref:EGF-like domain-containing protein n=1 Tax=Tieghemostelium lacteum TaxID=361077 RepID=A0A151ZHY9_TIELA|nr:EGF-like domain-containing protein [Tieghemostelium lacteum]|eukprot:KYQ93586.1 EGF-like domain-containing protein [Tieghemostelium lacteum]